MTTTLPTGRLVDLLKKTSKKTLDKHTGDFVKASNFLSPEEMSTRFLRNHGLISPKALFLLKDDKALPRYHTFAVYKPPFCPMRKADAGANFHRVSVEGFINAALKSRDIYPVLRSIDPARVKIRVLNDIDDYASGPVLVSMSDAQPFTTALDTFVMEYHALLAGHLPMMGPKPIDAALLFPNVAAVSKDKEEEEERDGAPSSTLSSSTPPSCTYEVERNAYYGPHATSLVRFVIRAPPTSLPPRIDPYVREHLDTFVLGDPIAMSEIVRDSVEKRRNMVGILRGDIDFPRVFTHLRQVTVKPVDRDANGNIVPANDVVFHCYNCFEPLLKPQRLNSPKHLALKLLDGSWTPEVEFF